MKRVLACALLALAGVAVAAPSASPPPETIDAGVRIGDVPVGGLTAEPARARLLSAFEQPVRFVFHRRTWSAAPSELGARPAIGAAVTRALQAGPSKRLRLRVSINRDRLESYVAGLDKRLARPAVDAQVVGLSGDLRPLISEPRAGQRVDRAVMTHRIAHALRAGDRQPIALVVREVEPSVTEANVGPVVVIKRDSHELVLYNGSSVWRTFGVATGQSIYPTPPGDWHIVDMQVDPWWRPPDSAWAAGAKPIPPGPGNPLGTRWMGLDAAGVGIHATPDDASIGYSASHGCIRMHQPDAEWLFAHVDVGTPVFIRAV